MTTQDKLTQISKELDQLIKEDRSNLSDDEAKEIVQLLKEIMLKIEKLDIRVTFSY